MYSQNRMFGDEYIRYILETYSGTIIRLCYGYTGNKEDAEDIAQDVFVELVKRGEEFDDKDYEKAWLLRTAINKCKNHVRSGHFRFDTPLDDEHPIEDPSADPSAGDSPVTRAVMSLPEKYRTVIHLHFVDGFSIKEIASITGDNAATVGTRLSRGKQLLKKILKGDIDL